jgi:hypothetical protein
MVTKNSEEIRKKLAANSQKTAEQKTAPVVQEIQITKKTGRKKHRIEGVEYARLSAGIPEYLKLELDVAIKTTHKDFPTIDTFVAEAVRVFLSMRK